MKLKNLMLKTFITSVIITAPTTVIANSPNLKVAIIKSANNSQNVINGDYKEVIARLSNSKSSSNIFEEKNSIMRSLFKN